VPSIDPGGVVSTASYQPNAPVALGGFISIFGSNLARQATSATQLPFPTSLAGTKVVLGGENVPLAFAANGQVNAIVPYDLQVNATQQLIVQQNNTYSLPQPVLVGAAQPAVFTQNQSGMGQGVIVVLKPNGTGFETAPSAPASAGDALVIYCSGLGAVSPPVPAGTAASLTQLNRTDSPVTVTIGGQSTEVLFAGLAPGFAGLYQVNAIVPTGIAASTSVPVVLTVGGQSSVPVTVSIQ
jgi:minor extracellular serine protease Vpr